MYKKLIITITICFFCLNAYAQDFKVLNISLDDSSQLLLINGATSPEDIEVSGGRLDNPPRAYLDIKNAVLTTPKQALKIPNSDITEIRMAQFSINPNVVRVVFTAKNQEALTKIRLIKNNNSIAFRLNSFNPIMDDFAIVYKDKPLELSADDLSMVPRKVNVVSKVSPKKSYIESIKKSSKQEGADKKPAKYSKYIITNVSLFNKQFFVTGIGNVMTAKPFILDSPNRIVFDFPNTEVQNKEILKEYKLSENEKVKIGEFEDNIIRIVITTDNPNKYKTVFSPDMQSFLISSEENLDYRMFPDSNSIGEIKNIDILKKDDKATLLTLKSEKPIIYSVKRTNNRILFELFNVSLPKEGEFSQLTSTNQFRGMEIDKLDCYKNGIILGIPVSKTINVETGLSYDGKNLIVKLEDTMVDTLNVAIGSNRKIVIDAGHGGRDAGCNSGNILEKNLTLEIAKRVEKYLKAQGIKVVMTRRIDEYLSLKARTKITNREGADAFISIHVNASEKPSINGLETHWYTYTSKDLARIVHNNLYMSVASPDRGLFRSKFYVIHHTIIPSILVEVGFISNEKEKYQMTTEQRKDDTARSISNGILLYLAKKYKGR